MTDSRMFPQGFMWGSATSAHQIEGNNDQNDWWDWEIAGRTNDRSGQACDSYRRFREDLDLAKSLDQNAHRFSIEWSRVEPREGEFSGEAIAHYTEVIRQMKSRGLEPVVTLHHFTIPRWMAARGGWENRRSPEWFARFAKAIVRAIGYEVTFWITFNEQNVLIHKCYIEGSWPPGKPSVRRALRASRNIVKAHCAAYDMIHRTCDALGWNQPMVGLAQHMLAVEPRNTRSNSDRFSAWLRGFINNEWFVRLAHRPRRTFLACCFGFFRKRRSLDFFGVNYYFREIVRRASVTKGLYALIGDVCFENRNRGVTEHNQLNWEIFPEGLHRMILHAHRRYAVPVMVTENGICTLDECQRRNYIRRHVEQVLRAVQEGVKVLGFFYWSLLDNFEWSIGYMPKFGLIKVDMATGRRTVKDGALEYARICRDNALPGKGS